MVLMVLLTKVFNKELKVNKVRSGAFFVSVMRRIAPMTHLSMSIVIRVG